MEYATQINEELKRQQDMRVTAIRAAVIFLIVLSFSAVALFLSQLYIIGFAAKAQSSLVTTLITFASIFFVASIIITIFAFVKKTNRLLYYAIYALNALCICLSLGAIQISLALIPTFLQATITFGALTLLVGASFAATLPKNNNVKQLLLTLITITYFALIIFFGINFSTYKSVSLLVIFISSSYMLMNIAFLFHLLSNNSVYNALAISYISIALLALFAALAVASGGDGCDCDCSGDCCGECGGGGKKNKVKKR